ncbi:hypothetical protein BBJ28_00020446 [Nothophytophthora sp. Chile5]|nr:hypothetical protein BBJ28_00020446 [Nothophytophthora sp. Chile5]
MFRLSSVGLFSLASLLLAPHTCVAEGGDGPAWGYHPEGEEHGGELSPVDWASGYASCGGSSQSPIDLSTYDADASDDCDVKDSAVPLSFSGDCVSFSLEPSHGGLKWGATSSDSCKVHKGETTYSLLQFHMHVMSEHTVDGYQYDAEAHFVHQEDGGDNLLVIGVFLEEQELDDQQKKPNAWMNSVWHSLNHMNETVHVHHPYAALLLKRIAHGDVFNYAGSLTTPPCSEIVDWWVVGTPLKVQAGALDPLNAILEQMEATDDGENARATQSLNGRTVVTYTNGKPGDEGEGSAHY